MRESLGIIEVQGKLGAVVVADVMLKSSNVHVKNIERTNGSGWMVVKVVGDVGSVQAAIETATNQAQVMGIYVASKIIPRPAEDIEKFFLQEPVVEVKKEVIEIVEPLVESVVETEPEKTEEVLEVVEVIEPILVEKVEKPKTSSNRTTKTNRSKKK